MTHSKILPTALCLFIACTLTTPLSAELVGYWNFDGNVEDQSGTGNDGEVFDAEYSDNFAPATGSGQSISFEDDFAHVFIEADPSLDSEEFTLAMFVYDRGQVGALERLTSRQDDQFETAINVHPPFGGDSEFAYYSAAGGGWQWGDAAPPIDEWQHVAYVANVDEESLSIYVDGVLEYTSPEPWSTTPSGFMHIGNRWNDVEGFDGLMDDVALWDEVLSDDDIMQIATRGVARFLNQDSTPGDYNRDGIVDAVDIDLQAEAMLQADPDIATFDETGDGVVNQLDREVLIKQHLRTWMGDSNLDGEFNSGDLVFVFTAGSYESNDEAGWSRGDWNGDLVFNSTDFVIAFTGGGYEAGPAAGIAAVPEPACTQLFLLGAMAVAVGWRRRHMSNTGRH